MCSKTPVPPPTNKRNPRPFSLDPVHCRSKMCPMAKVADADPCATARIAHNGSSAAPLPAYFSTASPAIVPHPQGVRMLSLRLRVAMVLATASLIASGCAQNREKTPAYVPFPDLSQVGLRKVWERQVATAPGEKINNAWRVGDSVYLTTDQSRILRIVAASDV